MATKVEKTYTYTCDICGRPQQKDGLCSLQIEHVTADFCGTCMGRPLAEVLVALQIYEITEQPAGDPVPA